MLAAECTCAMLGAEHSVLRQTLAALAAALQAQPPAHDRVRTLLQFLDVFEHRCHRPKETLHLLPALAGKSRDADRLIAALHDAHGADDGRLERAFSLLGAVERGDERRLPELELALTRHREALLQRLHTEEATLLTLARRLLGVDEWSRIASGVSRVGYPDGALYMPDRPLADADDAPVTLGAWPPAAAWPAASAWHH